MALDLYTLRPAMSVGSDNAAFYFAPQAVTSAIERGNARGHPAGPVRRGRRR
jgi:hypothetical protein